MSITAAEPIDLNRAAEVLYNPSVDDLIQIALTEDDAELAAIASPSPDRLDADRAAVSTERA